MLSLQVIPGASFLHKLDPRSKFVLFFVVVSSAVLFTDPIYCGAFLVALIAITRACNLSIRKTALMVRASSPLLVASVLVNVVLGPANAASIKNPSNILFYVIPVVKWLPVTPQGVVQSIALGIRFAIVVYMLQLIFFTTPVMDMVLALVKWKVPAGLALGISIGFTFVPVFMGTALSIMDAQACRGWKGLKAGNLAERIRALPVLLVPLFLEAIEKAQKIAVAIEARGFGYNLPKRTWSRELRLGTIDYVAMAIELVILAASAILWYAGYGTYTFTYSLLASLRP